MFLFWLSRGLHNLHVHRAPQIIDMWSRKKEFTLISRKYFEFLYLKSAFYNEIAKVVIKKLLSSFLQPILSFLVRFEKVHSLFKAD